MISINYDDSTVILSTKTAPSVADGVNVKVPVVPLVMRLRAQPSVVVAVLVVIETLQ